MYNITCVQMCHAHGLQYACVCIHTHTHRSPTWRVLVTTVLLLGRGSGQWTICQEERKLWQLSPSSSPYTGDITDMCDA